MEATPFSTLAEHYDAVMSSVDYDSWATYSLNLLLEAGYNGEGVIGDLGCGTGAISRRFAGIDLPVAALDLSLAMVQEGRRRGSIVHYGAGDLRHLPLRTGSLGAAVCLFDTLNYLVEPSDFRAALVEVHRTLQPGAPFLFDLVTRYSFRSSWCGPEQIIVHSPDRTVIWEGFMESDDIARLDLTLYVSTREAGLFRRVLEVHRERAYDIPTVRRALAAAGFENVQVFAHLTKRRPGSRTPRLMFAANAGASTGSRR